MESLDENQLGDKIKLLVPYKESYIKSPFNALHWSGSCLVGVGPNQRSQSEKCISRYHQGI